MKLHLLTERSEKEEGDGDRDRVRERKKEKNKRRHCCFTVSAKASPYELSRCPPGRDRKVLSLKFFGIGFRLDIVAADQNTKSDFASSMDSRTWHSSTLRQWFDCPNNTGKLNRNIPLITIITLTKAHSI